MPTTIKVLLPIAMVLLLLVSCGAPTGNSSSEDKFEGVPSGEIVPVEKRDSVLTGINISESLDKNSMTTTEEQKWWQHIVSELDYTGCEGYQDTTITLDNTYFAFKPSGSLYYKIGKNGSERRASTWSWTDESKSFITLGKYPDVEFELRSLNEDEVVYASKQESGGCTAVTWEQFQQPYVEGGEEADIPVTYDMQWTIGANETLHDELAAELAESVTFRIESYPENGTLELLDDNTGEFEYEPDLNFVGDDSFTFSAGNESGYSDPSTGTIKVEGQSSEVSNEFTYGGVTYALNWGYSEDYGEVITGFRERVFLLTEQEENWIEVLGTETERSNNSAYWIGFLFESLGAESFNEGVYEFSQDPVQANHLNAGIIFFENGEDSYVTDGAVEIVKYGDEYSLSFDLILENDKRLQGSFTYPFTVVDLSETSESTSTSKILSKLKR